MTKRNKIIYWIATIWLSLGMSVTGIGQIINMQEGAGAVISMTKLGYPLYLLTIIGVLKVLGVIAVLIPKYPLIKEWTYAGFVFLMLGAFYSHVAVGDPAVELFGSGLLLVLSLISWYFRPADRKIILANS